MPFIQFQFRRGTASEWSSASPNPVLAAGEMGIETDTNLFKIGDGVLDWNALPYGGLQGPGVGPNWAYSTLSVYNTLSTMSTFANFISAGTIQLSSLQLINPATGGLSNIYITGGNLYYEGTQLNGGGGSISSNIGFSNVKILNTLSTTSTFTEFVSAGTAQLSSLQLVNPANGGLSNLYIESGALYFAGSAVGGGGSVASNIGFSNVNILDTLSTTSTFTVFLSTAQLYTSTVDFGQTKILITGDINTNGRIAVGKGAGQDAQGNHGIAVGTNAGQYGKNASGTVAIGWYAGNLEQSQSAIAIGQETGYSNQATFATAIGFQAGYSNQGNNAIAIGYQAGYYNQSTNTIVLNANTAELNTTKSDALFIAPVATRGTYNNFSTLFYDDTTKEVFAGPIPAGGGGSVASNIGFSNVKILDTLSTTSTFTEFISAGTAQLSSLQLVDPANGGLSNLYVQSGALYFAGSAVGGGGSVASNIGFSNVKILDTLSTSSTFTNFISAQSLQISTIGFVYDIILNNTSGGEANIAIGTNAGNDQLGGAIAIGIEAGQKNQDGGIAIGTSAGQSNQQVGAIAIGSRAGQSNQQLNSIAIGNGAGAENQSTQTIVLNATGLDFNTTKSNALFIAPIATRGTYDTFSTLFYDDTTKEVFAGPIPAGGGGSVASNIGFSNVKILDTLSTTSTFTEFISAGTAQLSSLQLVDPANGGLSNLYVQSGALYFAGSAVGGGGSVASNIGFSNVKILDTLSTTSTFTDFLSAGTAFIDDLNASTLRYVSNVRILSLDNKATVQIGRNITGSAQNSVAIGVSAGVEQGNQSIAIGSQAAGSSQSSNAIAIGATAGNISQATGTVAIGGSAGGTNQNEYSVSVGY